MLLCQNFEKVDLFLTWAGGPQDLVLHQPWLKVDKMVQKILRPLQANDST
jgi:hypothetical protein